MKITIIIYTRLFILFPNLTTKESYNWWVTRRVWGFRHQISKAKYLKMSVAHIGKLQENNAALCKNGCETLWVSAIRGSGYVWSGKLKRPPLPSGVRHWMWNIRMECRQRRIPNVRHPGGMSAEQNSGCETSGWNVRCHTWQGGCLRVQGVGTPPPDDTEHASLSGATTFGFS